MVKYAIRLTNKSIGTYTDINLNGDKKYAEYVYDNLLKTVELHYEVSLLTKTWEYIPEMHCSGYTDKGKVIKSDEGYCPFGNEE